MLPGFHDLSQDDQLILIKAGFYEIWLTQHTRLFNTQEQSIMFGDGSVVAYDQMEMVFTVSYL